MGKSTLLKIITRVLQPDGGYVSTSGKITALLELGAGFNPEFTGIENIHFYAGVLGLNEKEIDEKLGDIIDFAELGDYLNQPLKTYSSGMRSRLGFAVAAHVDPDILILDEVLAVGDDAFKAKCFRKIQEFFDSGKTVILVSHSIHNINQLCSRAIFLNDGAIANEGRPKDVTQAYHSFLFGGESKKQVSAAPKKHDVAVPKSSSWDNAIVVEPLGMMDKPIVKTFNYQMLDEQRRVTNVLAVDLEYEFCFEADIGRNQVEDILFGVTFVTSKGIHVCGVEPKVYKTSESFIKLGARFKCIFNEDIYTIIVASRLRSKDIVFYSRVENIGCFRVVNVNSEFRWGLVQL